MLFGACIGSLHRGCPEQISLKPAGMEEEEWSRCMFSPAMFSPGLVELFSRLFHTIENEMTACLSARRHPFVSCVSLSLWLMDCCDRDLFSYMYLVVYNLK